MRYLINRRLVTVWAVLSLITLVSWRLGPKQAAGFQPNAALTMAVIVLAVVKVRVVLREFMEIGHAARWLRVASDIWIVLFPICVFLAISF